MEEHKITKKDKLVYAITLLAIFGGVIGLILCLGILRNYRSAIIALWVCFAENPSFLERNRNPFFNKLIGSHEKLDTFYTQIISDRDIEEDNY